MQPDLGSNQGPSAYRANALPTELPDCLHIFLTVPVHTQSLPLHYNANIYLHQNLCKDDSNKWSKIGFGEEITQVESIELEVNLCTLIWGPAYS